MIFPNTYEKIIKMLSAMNEAGVKPELECFDTGHTSGIRPLLDMGILKAPLQFSFIVNVLGGIPGHVESLQLQTKIMPAGSEWVVIAISHGHWRMLAAASCFGGNIRTGLEDHLYLPNGEMAKSNAELVEVAARMIARHGAPPRHGRRGARDPRLSGAAVSPSRTLCALICSSRRRRARPTRTSR